MMHNAGPPGTIPLEPGQPYRQTLDLTPGIEADVFDENDDHPNAEDHPSPFYLKLHPRVKTQWLGQYRIAVRVDSVETSNATFEQAPPISVTVTPKDDQKLRLVCENLTRQIQNKDDAKSMEALDELLSIHDPVAVPSLRALLGMRVPTEDVIRALQRIGNFEAADAIRTLLSSPDPKIVKAAKEALQTIEPRAKDERRWPHSNRPQTELTT